MNWNNLKKQAKKKRIQIIAIVITLVFVLLSVGGLVIYKAVKDRNMENEISALNEKTKVIKAEYDRVTAELAETRAEYNTALKNNTSRSMLIFAQCFENLYDTVYPAMNKYALTGVFVVSDEYMVGNENCITAVECREMLEANWTMAIAAPSDGTNLDEYFSGIRTTLAKNGIDFPEAFYFPVGRFSKETYEAVKGQFKTVLYCLNDDTGEIVFPPMKDIDGLMVSPYMYTSLTTPIWLKYSQYMLKGNSCSIATGQAIADGNYASDRKGLDTSAADLYDIAETLTKETGYYRSYSVYRIEQLKEDTAFYDIKIAYEEKIASLKQQQDELSKQLSLYISTDNRPD